MKRKILSAVLALTMLFGTSAFAEVQSDEYDRFERLSNYASILYIDDSADADEIMTEALKTVMKDNPELMNSLIKAGFQSLDEYTEYYTQEEYELFNKNINHIVYGIGVIIQQLDGYVTVMSCTEGGGAEAVGIQAGDKIYKVEDVDVTGQSVDKVQDLILGEEGTDVNVTVLRGETELTYTITRSKVTGTTVSGEILKGNIGYISIVNFAANTANEFEKTLAEFSAAGVEKIILDLRDNPGGYLDAAVDIARMTVPKGVIVSTVYRSEYENEVFYSELEQPKYEFAVLVNENTASAAEVLASAMKESGVGYLIGDVTYGKGVIQQMFEIWDGCAFKITTGKYFTRNGNDINASGIEPDEFIDNTSTPVDITKYSVFDYKTKPKLGDTSPNVRAAKERLAFMGYYQAAADENFEPALENAIIRFQAANGLYPYGVLDVSTQVKLENIFYKMEVVNDDQLIYAYEYMGGNSDDLEWK